MRLPPTARPRFTRGDIKICQECGARGGSGLELCTIKMFACKCRVVCFVRNVFKIKLCIVNTKASDDSVSWKFMNHLDSCLRIRRWGNLVLFPHLLHSRKSCAMLWLWHWNASPNWIAKAFKYLKRFQKLIFVPHTRTAELMSRRNQGKNRWELLLE